jgi:Tat protein secretion system quality control protein TatD with DNase activity
MFLNLVSTEPDNTIKAIEIARKTKIAKVLMAIHPTDIDKYEINEVEKQFDSFYEQNKDLIIGIGECGLDKKHPELYPDFEKQVK